MKFRPTDGPWELRRPLKDEERLALEKRRDELALAIAPSTRADVDRVALAISQMFAGFHSMRQTEDEAMAKIDNLRNLLSEYPAWAVEKACRSIQTDGFMRDGKVERNWPPSDSEVVHLVRMILSSYVKAHDSAVAILEGRVA